LGQKKAQSEDDLKWGRGGWCVRAKFSHIREGRCISRKKQQRGKGKRKKRKKRSNSGQKSKESENVPRGPKHDGQKPMERRKEGIRIIQVEV